MKMLVACVVLASLAGFGSANAQELKTQTLPVATWQMLEQARGIRAGGAAESPPNIQVIFDVNCPYCARLYEALRRDHPEIAVRWIPIAYFRPDSAQLAAAIINSADPATSLRKNFDDYDYSLHHGGYCPSKGSSPSSFGEAQVELKKYWEKWGAYTPMYIFRDRQGRIQKTGGSAAYIVKRVIEASAPGLAPYEPALPRD